MEKKRIYMILIMCLQMITGLFAQEAVIDSSYANSYYQKRQAYYDQLPKVKNAIVFLGNSITEAGQWYEIAQVPHIINRGISGDVTYGILNRLSSVTALHPKKIFMTVGINDVKRGIPPEYTVQNIERIIKRVRKDSPKTKLLIQSVLPVRESMFTDGYQRVTNQKVVLLNEQIKTLCQQYNVPFIDVHQAIFMDKEGRLKQELTTDGIHLRAEAYIQWIEYLKTKKYL
ncbi:MULTISPECIES: GDSL-type esterase/lipase family protein [unclassified Sphingobacterium]|uniref:GDSL-type esterase/lipase family protein n=1 Tax=unclassified Sphingobacterium TaxID=2609468 RepID=UPI0025E70CBD|nr:MULTISPECIES: GDSL-type esterase/lipase family protein [unclassified Sphingobacterium]